jgi:hypothetical protein
MVILPGNKLSITEAATDLFKRIGQARKLFFRGGKVHEVLTDHDGASRLEVVASTKFRSTMENYGQVLAWRTGKGGSEVLKPTICSDDTARALLETAAARERLPNILTLAPCPVLAKCSTGAMVLGPGWHDFGGGLFVTGGDQPPVIALPEAVRVLSEMLEDFDFSEAGDRSRAIASLIGPALRLGGWLKDPLPIDIGEADASQSGKTYRQKMVAAIYRATPNVVTQRTGGVGGLDESIAQKLIDGRPFILFDNLRGKLDSPYLEAVLTAPGPMPARVPHRGEVTVDTRGFIFQITSNGVETTRDLANRGSIIRIRKRKEGYRFRAYPEGDIHTHVVANQAKYLGSVFSVINEWVTRGEKRTGETRHNFREWAQTLDWIVQNIFSAVPLMEGHQAASERVTDPHKIWLRSLCIALRDAGRTGDFFASQLADFAADHDVPPPNIHDGADTDAVARAIGKIMSRAFSENSSVIVDGFSITRGTRRSEAAGKNINTYTFDYGLVELKAA